MVIFVCHHSGDGGFRPSPGGGGHRRKGDDFFMDSQQALQLGHRSAWPGKPCCRRLGCIHRAAAADGHHTVAPLRPELGHELLHRLNFRIGRHLVEPAPGRQPFHHSNELRRGALAPAGHDHGLFTPGALQQPRQALQASGPGDTLRLPPGQHPGPQAKACLENSAIYPFKQHSAHIPSGLYYAAFGMGLQDEMGRDNLS